jgi:hypothetical protein
MSELDWLAGRFEENRDRLRAMAHWMLGSVAAAFLAASQRGDFAALLELLDPGVVLRATTQRCGSVRPGSSMAPAMWPAGSPARPGPRSWP